MWTIFLDFDGVINRGPGRPADKASVANLNAITNQTKAGIVVHSSWRWSRSLETLRTILKGWGVKGEVLDACDTPPGEMWHGQIWIPGDTYAEWQGDIASSDERAVAIQRWLNAHPEVTRYVILDDCSKLGHFVGSPAFIRTHGGTGLTERDAERAVRWLRGA